MATPAIGSVTRCVADADVAGIDRQQAVDAAQQRGLAAAGRADDRDDFALADIEVDVAENLSAP